MDKQNMNIMELMKMKGKHCDRTYYCFFDTDNSWLGFRQVLENIIKKGDFNGYYKTNDCTTYGKRIK